MKKRLILINSLIIVFALLFSLIYNIVLFSNMNKSNTRQELSNYLNIATQVYDSTNEDEVTHLFDDSNKKIRVTIIDLDGNVIADSFSEDISSNHLFREEIKNLGTFVERKSTSLGINMLYVAAKDDGHYIRVALEISSIDKYVWNYVLTDGLTTLVLLALSVGVLILMLRKYLEPLSKATKKLQLITDMENLDSANNSDSMESLVSSLDKASDMISFQMESLKEEKDKIFYIINHISQGLIIIDSQDNVDMINDYALKLLDLELEDILHKNYIYCFRNKEINENIELARKSKDILISEIVIGGFTYQVGINQFDDKIAILLTDITKQKNLDSMKREFFQNASHELKSPLTSIIGYQQMIKEGIVTDEQGIKDATAKTLIEANRMNDIIIEMLDLSKLESQIRYELEEVELSQVIEETLRGFENEILAKNIKVVKKLAPNVIMSHKDHVYTLIKNIIDNAIKYNKDGGTIVVTLKNYQLSVEDTGVGIEEKSLSRIFERFYRVDKAKSKTLGSTGLGLAIVKHICIMYKYEIKVTSKLGVGSKFTISFKNPLTN
ncbi:MAG TPA: hypothetical protein GX010_02165 [Erysipelotrichaceae bacterium]|nr:hypothetical protein [Erysipelotrichaceae bacterium]